MRCDVVTSKLQQEVENRVIRYLMQNNDHRTDIFWILVTHRGHIKNVYLLLIIRNHNESNKRV